MAPRKWARVCSELKNSPLIPTFLISSRAIDSSSVTETGKIPPHHADDFIVDHRLDRGESLLRLHGANSPYHADPGLGMGEAASIFSRAFCPS